jgi:hypothetical protein
MGLMSNKRDSYLSPVIEARMPHASLEEKRAAQLRFWALFAALYSVYEDMEREHRFPLADDNYK